MTLRQGLVTGPFGTRVQGPLHYLSGASTQTLGRVTRGSTNRSSPKGVALHGKEPTG